MWCKEHVWGGGYGVGDDVARVVTWLCACACCYCGYFGSICMEFGALAGENLVGKDDQCDVMLDHVSVSNKHASIDIDEETKEVVVKVSARFCTTDMVV